MLHYLTHDHVFTLQSREKVHPVCPSLLQAVWPELQEQLRGGIVGQNTIGTTQRMKFISLNIHFDEIDSLAGSEVIVQCYDIDRQNAAQIFPGRICPVIDVEFI